ncbi:MAG: TIM barrel protein [Zavarzinia sp.]|nr:TIM barrel protein [Zavarzinia sp.]
MPRFAANLTMMFGEWAFLDRFRAAADAGFAAVEFLFPYDHAPEVIARHLTDNGLSLALFNLPPGDWAAGDRGLAALPERRDELRAGIDPALRHAEATGVPRLHLMAGIAERSDPSAVAAYRDAVALVADRLGEKGLGLTIEPINRRGMPGYFLDDFAFAEALIADLARPNLTLQFDVFHRQILHGDVTMALRRLMPVIGHVQIAGVPARHEPDEGEVNYPFVFAELDALGYQGFVGCEYIPREETVAGLGWRDQARRTARSTG